MNVFNSKLQSYIDTLAESKRNKYTIKNDMYLNILNVLKSNDINRTPKLIFWVRQTFKLVEIGSSELIYDAKKNLLLITFEIYVKKLKNVTFQSVILVVIKRGSKLNYILDKTSI